MLFNSLQFLLFFPSICIIYWLVKYISGQYAVKLSNLVLLVGSYYFYMCWKPEYAILLFMSTFVTYCGARIMAGQNSRKGKRMVLITILAINISALIFFKYIGFAASVLTSVLNMLGAHMQVKGLDILLPVGISFYIFQALGYSIDVYRGTCKPEKDLFTYALFVSFFPQLVAGPIERSDNLLPQFHKDNKFDYDYAMSGFRLMLWGYLLKLCLADRASIYVNQVFNNVNDLPGGVSPLIAGILFTLQIYGDFAGYSFIAIGCSRIMGFSLKQNFDRPYLSVTLSQFWRKWHISLSRWLRDYVYIPLGGSRTKKRITVYRNLLITFGISGLWHGANYTFIVWGLMHGIGLCFDRLVGWNKKLFTGLMRIPHTLMTFAYVCLAFVVFRAASLHDAITVLGKMMSPAALSLTNYRDTLYMCAISAMIVFGYEIVQEFGLRPKWSYKKVFNNYLFPIATIIFIALFGEMAEGVRFIYFQF